MKPKSMPESEGELSKISIIMKLVAESTEIIMKFHSVTNNSKGNLSKMAADSTIHSFNSHFNQ